ncbi:MAG: TonB-dependent receptor [Novosphingobium sp. 28-62-57]|uniref:TonB-dependent receptor domain-containing protein n=1 Tax=unclassified Novosphingobium TaxID=2644732 RepID=UPI000BC7D8CE|nr:MULTISPECIES: TonB-dependent receptor [unclassified Novosphingobium]OYW50948.1 MAG: TonB-dependent receptor [Novosphingobium sp. 12-62-10]OYZ10101.1 MAG: TonB-dependent receptor [Novosphingobium sp. 28-62-57]OZA31625.1 MAG: TonB-dependent receptor [Novosphingobium sp. 17-62-9]
MRIVAVLLASTSLFIAPAVAAAQQAPAAAEAAEAAAADSADAEIVVLGAGQTRQVQELSTRELTILASGTSPLKAIEKLPSVNFQSADAFGNYEWSTRVTIRGFNQNQLGFNLDGIPLGDMSYGNANGLHISRAISPENIGITRVSQGSGSIAAQSTNNLGGTLEFFSLDPKDTLGVTASGSYGSANTFRGFARIGLGTEDGLRGYVSAQYQNGDKWKGDGQQRTLMFNAKAIMPLGEGVDLDGYLSYSDRAEQDYHDLSLEMINRLGYDWDNFGPGRYAEAVRIADIAANTGYSGVTPTNLAAGTTYPAPFIIADDAYYDASGLRKDTIAALGLNIAVGDTGKFSIKGYYHENDGQGTWGTPYLASPSGVPMSIRTTEYDIKRKGFFASYAATYGINNLLIGGWYEKNDFIQSRRFYGYESRTSAGRDHRDFQRNPFFTQWSIAFETDTIQYYVSDELDLGDLKLNVGWKGFSVDTNAFALVNTNNRATGDLKVEDWFQPHIGLNYKFGNGLEAFAGFTQVTRAHQASTTGGPFSSTQAGFDAIKDTIKPERSDTYEAGVRYSTGIINASLAGYYVNFSDRLLVIPTSLGIVGATNALQNVGSVRALGIEAAVDVKLPGGFGAFASYSYNDSTYRDDVVIASTTPPTIQPTKGKTVVDTPKHLLRGELSYDSDTFYGRVGVNYMSKRFFNYLNDRSVGARTLVDATIGYRLDIGQRQPVELQINGVNLTNKRYVATIGSNGFGFSGDNQTLLAGAPRQVFATLKVGF